MRPDSLIETCRIEEMALNPEGDAPAVATQAPAKKASIEPKKTQGKRRTSMSVINFWLDTTILAVLVVLGWEAAVLKFLFPAPTMAAGWSLWGLNYDQWDDVRFGTLCLFALGILIHVMLHWNWVCSVLAAQIIHSRERPDEGK